jgi:hypothetical protein
VFVNYGTDSDLEQLRELNVLLTGTIAVARAGRIHTANKAANVAEAGAKGLVIFPDPEDVAPRQVCILVWQRAQKYEVSIDNRLKNAHSERK